KGGITAGAPASNGHSLAVNIAALFKVSSRVDAVVDVDDSPLPSQAFTICAPIPSAAAIVHVHNCNSSARPVLNSQSESRRRRAGGTAMADNNERWAFANRSCHVLV